MSNTSWQERFWLNVNKTGTCWLWKLSHNHKGYGSVSIQGRTKAAHRVAYELLVGTIPKSMVVDHVCHVRHCVNPKHLRLVTTKQNAEHRVGANKNSASGVRGVHLEANSGKWIAQLCHNGERVALGRYTDLQDAAEAVRLKRIEIFTHSDNDQSVKENA